jgi:hypothetical protein
MNIICTGGWESDCSIPDEEGFFHVGDNTYNFSTSVKSNTYNAINFDLNFKSTKVVLRQRFIMAYASHISETEGVVFCDTSLSQIKSQENTKWYSNTAFVKLKKDTSDFYILNTKIPPYKSFKEPLINTASAKRAIEIDHDWVFDTGTNDELRKNREVRLWPYAIELELTTNENGKPTIWKFRFRMRHGEC